MGTYNKGILGAFSGKVGPVVGANWRGKDIMRSLPKKSKRRASAIQMQQRQKFAMVSELLNGLQPVIKRYYGSDGGLKTRRNQLMSYLLKEALMYNDPDFEYPEEGRLVFHFGMPLVDVELILAKRGLLMSWV